MINFLVHEYCSHLFIYRRLKPYVWMKTPLPDRVQMNILYFDITGFDNHDGNHKPKIGLQWTWNIVDISRSNKSINASSTNVPATGESSYEWYNQSWSLVCVPDHVTLHCCVLVLLIRIVRFLDTLLLTIHTCTYILNSAIHVVLLVMFWSGTQVRIGSWNSFKPR